MALRCEGGYSMTEEYWDQLHDWKVLGSFQGPLDCVAQELLLANLKAYGVADHGVARFAKLFVWKVTDC